jgi:hypothetical protein
LPESLVEKQGMNRREETGSDRLRACVNAKPLAYCRSVGIVFHTQRCCMATRESILPVRVKMRPTNVTLTPDQLKEIDKIRRPLNRTRSEVVRELIDRALVAA